MYSYKYRILNNENTYNKMAKINVISLYSGAGGLDLGFEQAGFKIKLAIEIDKSCCKTLKKNFKNLKVLNEDINNISYKRILKEAEIKKVDLLIGGPPCQSFSLAGKRKGLKDKNGKQIINFIKLIMQLKPKVFLIENVKGMVNWKKGLVLEYIVDELSKKFMIDGKSYKYNIDYKVLNALNYGVPQVRERIFIVGNLFNKRFSFPNEQYAANNNQPSLFGNLKKIKTVKDAISKLPKADEPSIQALSVAKTIKKRINDYGY